jgi:hypothetical protein
VNVNGLLKATDDTVTICYARFDSNRVGSFSIDGNESLEEVGRNTVVGIEEDHDLSRCPLDARVARCPCATALLVTEEEHTFARHKTFDCLRRAVRGAIVDDDHIER